MSSEEIIEKYRKGLIQLDKNENMARMINQYSSIYEEQNSINAEFRHLIVSRLFKNYTIIDKPLIRYLLEQEALWCEHGFTDELVQLCYMLYKIGNIDDIQLLWEIKNNNFDTYCGLDIQLVAVPDVDDALEYLRTKSEEWAFNATNYIESCLNSGDFCERVFYLDKIESQFNKEKNES